MKIFVVVLVLFAFGCSQNENSKENLSSVESFKRNDSITSKITEPIVLDSTESLRLFKNFAKAYNPPNKKIGSLPELNDTLKAAIENVKTKSSKEFKTYLSLIFIKLYRSNLRSSLQSFDFRKNTDSIDKVADPLIYEFNEMARFFPKGKRVEFFSSGLAERWIGTNPDLLNNQEIKREMVAIQSVSDSIMKELYWK